MGTVYVLACESQNIAADGTCTVPVWIEKPEQVLPPLSLVDGAEIAFAIVGVWTLGLLFRVHRRALQEADRY